MDLHFDFVAYFLFSFFIFFVKTKIWMNVNLSSLQPDTVLNKAPPVDYSAAETSP